MVSKESSYSCNPIHDVAYCKKENIAWWLEFSCRRGNGTGECGHGIAGCGHGIAECGHGIAECGHGIGESGHGIAECGCWIIQCGCGITEPGTKPSIKTSYVGGMHLSYIRQLYWRDASLSTLDNCIGGMHLSIHYALVLKGCTTYRLMVWLFE